MKDPMLKTSLKVSTSFSQRSKSMVEKWWEGASNNGGNPGQASPMLSGHEFKKSFYHVL